MDICVLSLISYISSLMVDPSLLWVIDFQPCLHACPPSPAFSRPCTNQVRTGPCGVPPITTWGLSTKMHSNSPMINYLHNIQERCRVFKDAKFCWPQIKLSKITTVKWKHVAKLSDSWLITVNLKVPCYTEAVKWICLLSKSFSWESFTLHH